MDKSMNDIIVNIEYLHRLGIVTNELTLDIKYLDIDFSKLRSYAYHICCTFGGHYFFVDASLSLLNHYDIVIGGRVPIQVMETFFRHDNQSDGLMGSIRPGKRARINEKKIRRT